MLEKLKGVRHLELLLAILALAACVLLSGRVKGAWLRRSPASRGRGA